MIAYTHQPQKRKRAGRLAKQTRAEHVVDIAEKYARIARTIPGRSVSVQVRGGVIYIDGERRRISEVVAMRRQLEARAR